MEWSTGNSNNENGLLRANGPHRLRTADIPLISVRNPMVIESNKPITVGEVRVYGNSVTKENQEEPKNTK